MHHAHTCIKTNYAIVDKIRAGNPCEKAERLRNIKEEYKTLPQTEHILHLVNKAMERRKKRIMEQFKEQTNAQNDTILENKDLLPTSVVSDEEEK